MAQKLVSVICSLLLLLAAVPASIASGTEVYIQADFETEETGKKPAGFICDEGGGEIVVEELQGNRVLSVSNRSDGVYTKVSKKMNEIDGLQIIAGLAFMQKEVVVNGSVIMELSGSSGKAVSIETLGGDIIYRTGEKTYEVLVEDYLPNFWYNLVVKADLSAGTANVYVNNLRVLYMEKILNGVKGIDSLLSYTAYSPGYYLDNIILSTSQEADAVQISGEAAVSIPKSGTARYLYKARVTDAAGIPMQTEVAFQTNPVSISGVRLIKSDKEGKPLEPDEICLEVDAGTQVQTITLTATVEGEPPVVRSLNVQLKTAEPAGITIYGSAQITGELKEQKCWQYQADCVDELGFPVSGMSFTYGLAPVDGGELPDGIHIDPETGLLTVTASLSEYHQSLLRVTATGNSDKHVTGSKNIKILNKKAYISDEASLNLMIEYADYVLEAGKDIYHGTPLLADGIDVGTGLPFEWEFPKESGMEDSAVLSNLADQGGLMRFLETLSEITGDPKYRDRVMEIYDYFLDIGISPSGMAYWGGHACIDLKTGKVLYTPNDPQTHELKDHYPYMDPIYELDEEIATNIVKSTWASHIGDFSTMVYNRHGSFTAQPNIGATWDNLDCFDDTITGLLKSTDLPFRFTANDFIHMAAKMYEKTGDEKAKLWAYRLWSRYANVCHPETHMGGEVFTTAHEAPGTLDIMQQPPVGHWWDATPLPNIYTWTTYGDRAYNQFADPLVEAGYITEEQKDMVREANLITSFAMPAYTPQSDLYLAEVLGHDTPEGRRVLIHNTKMMGSWVYYGYIPETNMMRPMLYDGTDLSGYVWERTGYYGGAGNSFSQYPITQTLLFSLVSSYIESADLSEEELTCNDTKHPGQSYNAREEIYKMLRNLCISLGLGDIGDEDGNGLDLNFGTVCSQAKAGYALAKLYEFTGRTEYIDLARRVSENVIKAHYAFGVFREGLNYVNANFSIQNEWYPMMLISIEAISRGEGDKLPRWMPYNGYWSCDLLKPDGTSVSKAQGPWTAWSYTYETVKVTDIVPEAEEYRLKVGEELPLGYTVEPDDAADKSVTWYTDDMAVVQYDPDNDSIIAVGVGETMLHGVSASNLKVKTSIHITVE